MLIFQNVLFWTVSSPVGCLFPFQTFSLIHNLIKRSRKNKANWESCFVQAEGQRLQLGDWSFGLFGPILSVGGFTCKVHCPCLLAVKVKSCWVSVCQHSRRFIIWLWTGLLSFQLTRTRGSMPCRNERVITIQWTKYS